MTIAELLNTYSKKEGANVIPNLEVLTAEKTEVLARAWNTLSNGTTKPSKSLAAAIFSELKSREDKTSKPSKSKEKKAENSAKPAQTVKAKKEIPESLSWNKREYIPAETLEIGNLLCFEEFGELVVTEIVYFEQDTVTLIDRTIIPRSNAKLAYNVLVGNYSAGDYRDMYGKHFTAGIFTLKPEKPVQEKPKPPAKKPKAKRE
jgi:hypothetical protein